VNLYLAKSGPYRGVIVVGGAYVSDVGVKVRRHVMVMGDILGLTPGEPLISIVDHDSSDDKFVMLSLSTSLLELKDPEELRNGELSRPIAHVRVSKKCKGDPSPLKFAAPQSV
jgi:hypothetical protein